MYATDFEQSNHVIDKPSDMSRDECDPLNVCIGILEDGTPIIISCWKPTMDELEEIIQTGRVWVYHWGRTLQPHAVSGTNPFSGLSQNTSSEE